MYVRSQLDLTSINSSGDRNLKTITPKPFTKTPVTFTKSRLYTYMYTSIYTYI